VIRARANLKRTNVPAPLKRVYRPIPESVECLGKSKLATSALDVNLPAALPVKAVFVWKALHQGRDMPSRPNTSRERQFVRRKLDRNE
jgi:hypothetical protein